ncbi:response regulator [Plesiomonas shigelloides]|uniref:response regulator transcription factor n=1 Tax=Plesiomonas shigelloides TaxID=703 RepID=UPI00351CFDC1
MAKIVLLEDESDLLQETAAFLQSCGHVVTAVSSCAEFTAVMMTADIALIDIMLPDGNGFDMAAALRRVKPRAGIIILTAKNATEDKLRGQGESMSVHFSLTAVIPAKMTCSR